MIELNERLGRVCDLRSAAAVLEWDQETYMPSGSNAARSRQVATLRRMAHEILTGDETSRLLEAASPNSDLDKDIIRIARRDLERATRIPPQLIADLAKAVGHAKQAWQAARSDNRYDIFAPHLARIVDLNQQKADALGFSDEPYDALLDEFEPDAKTADVSKVFAELRTELVPIVRALTEAKGPDESILRRRYPRSAQWQLGIRMMRDIGYDFETGRQDESAHPFTTTFAISDVRVTTRISPHHFSPAFFGSLHEAGHGMYEQGIDPALDGTLLAEGTSLGMHESQSRLWENLVGRSQHFWRHYFPAAQAAFPATLADVSADEFYGAVNAVAPSLIRVEADEVTYNLHIMVRFEIERDLVTGRLDPQELPEAWNARMEDYLGVRPPDDSQGCLQDIHWSLGTIGYFPTYSLGNLMASQLWEAMSRELGDLEALVGRGSFTPILEWLRRNVHQTGRRRSASEILQAATGSDLDARPWLAYVRAKYGALYGVTL